MKYRRFGNTGFMASEVSLGTWQLGGKWGDEFGDEVAYNTLEEAYKNGINLFDTADIYQGGLSEKAIGKFIKEKKDKIFVVTKCGRKLSPHVASGYNKENIEEFVNCSLENMGVDKLDMVLLHCPPTETYSDKEVFDALDDLKARGKIAYYGVSVETVEEAITALSHNISAVEIIFNMFRLKPAEEFFKLAKEKDVAIIVRVPLASGLLTGKYTAETTFGKDDHRSYNRNGEAFNKGETFSGVDYATGLLAVDKLKASLGDNLAERALRYILMYDAVSTIIPGASRPEQIERNVKASESKDFTAEEMKLVADVYDEYIRETVHCNW